MRRSRASEAAERAAVRVKWSGLAAAAEIIEEKRERVLSGRFELE